MEIISSLTTPTPENLFAYKLYDVTGKIYYNDAWGNYSVFLVPSDYDFGAALADGATQPNGDAIMIYYKSNMEALQAFHGQEVTINILTQGWRSDKSVWYANFFGTPLDVDVNIVDDTEAVATALDALIYPEFILEDMTLLVPANLYGVALTYSSDMELVINSTTGVVDYASLTTQETVTLTITATRGAVTDTKDVVIKVGNLPMSTIADVLAATEGTFKLQGIVLASEYYGTYFIQDATDNIALYVGSATLKAILEANIGNEVLITGTRGAYHGLEQVNVETVAYVLDSTLPAATDLDAVDITNADFLPYQGEIISLTGLYVSDVYADSYGNITITAMRIADGTEIKLKWDSRVTLSTGANTAIQSVAVGDTIDITTVLGWRDAPLMYYTSSAVLTEGTPYTDAELLAADAARFPTDVTLTENFVLPELAFATATVVISTELQTNLTDDITANNQLVLVVPSAADILGTVTFTLTYGTATTDVIVNVTLDAFTDAEKLADDQASLSIATSVMANETVMLPLTGTLGSTIAWTVVSGDAVLNVDGTTLAYGYLATDFDVVLQAELSNGAEATVTKDFTVTVTGYDLVTDLATIYQMTDMTNYDIADGTDIYVQGVVTANSYDGLFIQDSNGVGFFMYKPFETGINIGDEVVYFGEMAGYAGGRQLGYGGELIAVLSTGNVLVVNTMTADQILVLNFADVGKLISFDGLVVAEYPGSNVVFDVVGLTTGQVQIRYFSPDWLPDVYEVGDTLPAVQFVLYNFRDGVTTLDMLDIELTDAQAIQLDADNVPTTLELIEDMEIPVGDYGSTFTITAMDSSLDAAIDYTTTPGTLLVTRPVGADAVGNITVQVTLGTETPIDVVIAVTVEMEEVVTNPITELFISEYADGTSNNKYVEIYNGTGADVDLTGYKLVLYNNGTTVAGNTTELTGTLLAGDVYVLYNSGANATIVAAGDITSTVTYFNGDDCVVLTKDDVIIDILLSVGHTNDLYVIADVTLIRKSSITGPSVTFDLNDWNAVAQDDWTDLGMHTVVLPVSEFVETFDTFVLTGTSYAAGSFVGVNSITWTYTESRGDFTLDGQAIMLDKNGDGSSLSATIQGGIASFSVDYYDAYSGAAQVELWINGLLVATSASFDDDGDGSVYGTFEVLDINTTGEFIIEILAAGSQMAIDNLTWTPYVG